MFRKSRQKIVAVIMMILVALLAGTLCVIYASSYAEVYQRNQNMLAHHIDLFSLDDRPQMLSLDDRSERQGLFSDTPVRDMEESIFQDDAAFQLSTFYSVALAGDGRTLACDNNSAVYTDDELIQIAGRIMSGERSSGTYGSLIYRCAEKGGYSIVAFMDNTVMQESITTLFRNTLLFGGALIVVIFFLACYWARKIVQPLEESYQKQRQFISDAGHELKTPVSVVNANAEMLSREVGENQWLSNIQYENARMGALITQLLELARAENTAPQMEKVDFSRIVTGEALAIEIIAYEKKLIFEQQIQENIAVNGDGNQLAQLSSILLDNAIRHSRPNGAVTISLTKGRSNAVFCVTNEGAEIPAENQERIFERFYRADESRTGGNGHYGLGLAIAKAIVTGHKGKIEVSCHDGLVEFRVFIPAV